VLKKNDNFDQDSFIIDPECRGFIQRKNFKMKIFEYGDSIPSDIIKSVYYNAKKLYQWVVRAEVHYGCPLNVKNALEYSSPQCRRAIE
jgi:hypothetical protein